MVTSFSQGFGKWGYGQTLVHIPCACQVSNCHPFHFFALVPRKNFEIKVLDRPSENELVFEMIGVDASFANALRRILLADVPTIAIEHVYMWNNTSIVHDEVLAHRLGLVPLNVDARLFDEMELGEDPTDRNTIVFRLAVTCGKKKSSKKDNIDLSPEDSVVVNPELDEAAAAAAANRKTAIETPGRPYTKHVYSSDLVWVPQGDQEEQFPDGIKPVHDDILLAKLRPGQVIELEAHAHWGTGQNHAKYSPVATACYRLMPRIELVKPVYDELAEELVNLYEPGVFDLVKTDSSDPGGKGVKARVVNPYACTMSRNFMRNPTLAESIKMSRVPNHFIFSVESVGMMSPAVLVAEALRVLQQKCLRLSELADRSGLATDGILVDDSKMED
jgi:DNA-directed RNA polymerase I and III subunit RPAC1